MSDHDDPVGSNLATTSESENFRGRPWGRPATVAPTTITKYRCWTPDTCDEREGSDVSASVCPREPWALNAEDAARVYAKHHSRYNDHPYETTIVAVRPVADDGRVRDVEHFVVSVEMRPSFVARPATQTDLEEHGTAPGIPGAARCTAAACNAGPSADPNADTRPPPRTCGHAPNERILGCSECSRWFGF